MTDYLRTLSEWVAEVRPTAGMGRDLNALRSYYEGPSVEPEGGVEWLASQLVGRVVDKFDSVLVVTGEEGISKSTLVYLLTLACNRLTGNAYDPTNLCYTPEDVVGNYAAMLRGTKPRASVIAYDEGEEGLLAGETFDPAQVVLVRTLFRARVVGAILIIAIPDIWALAKKVRARRARFWVDIEKRGTDRRPAPSVAAVFERDRTRHHKPTSVLGFSESPTCPKLTFAPPDPNTPTWKAWEGRKMSELEGFFVESTTVLAKRRKRLFGAAVERGTKAK